MTLCSNKMDFTYDETKQCCLYHFKTKVRMNFGYYSRCFYKDDKHEVRIKSEFRTFLKETIYKDVREIFDKYIVMGCIDYLVDWKISDYQWLLLCMMKDYYIDGL